MKKLHVWLSLPAGLFISLICFTGAILVFEKELTQLFADSSVVESVSGGHRRREGFFKGVMQLHRWLMLPDKPVGKIIVGTSTIFFIGIIVSGVCRWFRSRRYSIRLGAKWHRQLFDYHNVLGFYAAIILLVCAFTGLMWSFEWYRWAVAWLFDVDPENRRQMMRTAYSIHTGAWGGVVTQWLTFFAALIGGALPITGYVLYFRRKLRTR